MNLYTTEYIRTWQREGEYANYYVNDRRNDAASGLGNVMVMGLLHEKAQQLGQLPKLNEALVEWVGSQEEVDRDFPGWKDRAIKLIHDWSAEVYCHALLIRAAEIAGLLARVSYSPADDARGVDCTLLLFGREHQIQIKRAVGQPGNEDDVRKQFRRLARGEAEPSGVIDWRPPFDELDKTCQPYVPRMSHAEALFRDLA